MGKRQTQEPSVPTFRNLASYVLRSYVEEPSTGTGLDVAKKKGKKEKRQDREKEKEE